MGVHAVDFDSCSAASRLNCGKQHSICSEHEQRDEVSADTAGASYEGANVNARADNLMDMLRDGLTSLPGATSVTFHAQETWCLCMIIAVSDEAVVLLGKELGLALHAKLEEGERGEGRRWRRIAVGERGALRCEVLGPRHPVAAVVTLTAEQVLEAARVRGVLAFDTPAGERLILLASLGLDLQCDDVRAALLELHQRGALRLVSIRDLPRVRTNLAARGLRVMLVDDSALGDNGTVFHAVVLA
jgi:hypothetical protein